MDPPQAIFDDVVKLLAIGDIPGYLDALRAVLRMAGITNARGQ